MSETASPKAASIIRSQPIGHPPLHPIRSPPTPRAHWLVGLVFSNHRFLVLVLGVLCLVLLLVGFWLGAEQVARWTLTTSPSTELNVNVWGPVPDLCFAV